MKKTLCGFKKLIAIFLVLGMLASQFGMGINIAHGASGDFLITGTGIKEEVSISKADWSKYTLEEKIYSTNNSLGFHKIVKVKGYDLWDLIGKDNLKKDKNYSVKFISSDGFEITTTIEELTNTYYYGDFTEASKKLTSPMIAKYTKVLGDFPQNKFQPPVKWEDKKIGEEDLDKDFPKLTFGQKNIDDMNMSKWAKDVVKIVVGEEIKLKDDTKLKSSYKHISHDGAPYNVDAITSATLTVEGPALEGYRALSLRQLEEDVEGQEQNEYFEKMDGKVVKNTYEGINVKYLIDNYVNAKSNAENVVFKDKSRQTILTTTLDKVEKFFIAYGINGVPLVYLDTDVGYRRDKRNDDGCFKLVYHQEEKDAVEFSNVAYIYVEEKGAKNIFEHTYAPYDDPKYTDYEVIIHGDAIDEKVVYKVSEIEAMEDIKYEDEYSLSNSEYYWYYNRYKGVKLWDLLLKAGLDKNIEENTRVQFVAADNYNFQPLTIKDIKDNSLYGYYEKHNLDKGDGKFDGDSVEPLHSGMPPLVAYGFNGYPYVIRPNDEGFNPGLGNAGGPLRVIFGKTDYNDTNGSNQVQFIKEIILGEGEAISTGDDKTGEGDSTRKDIDPNAPWTHDQGVYKEYLDQAVLRVTGSDVKEPMTFTLRQIENLTDLALKDTYSGDGIHEFEGVPLWDIISKLVGLKDGVEAPSIRVFSGQNYNQILRSSEQVINGVLNSKGELKEIILAYAINGYPLVPNEGSTGYAYNNAFGPLRLILEENKSMWIKWTDCIVVGSGDYEAPKIEDVKGLDIDDKFKYVMEDGKTWLTYKNDTGKELPEASVRSMAYDNEGALWIGSNNGGVSVVTEDGQWKHYNEIHTVNSGILKVDTSYAIAQRENGELWIALGGFNTPQGLLVKNGNEWKQFNTENSELPDLFVQVLELDGEGGIWIGTSKGAAHVDKDENWTVYAGKEGLLPYSVDAIEADGKGGAWLGYYPATKGDEDNPIYLGGYQHLKADGTIITYDGFDQTNFNVNWVRSISMDKDGGVWIVRSGNAPGLGQGEVDYIIHGERTVYTASELYREISHEDDIRLLEADGEGSIYIGTLKNGIIKVDEVGKVSEVINSENKLPSSKWNNVYFLSIDDENILIGTNGGAGVYKEAKTFEDIKSHFYEGEISNMATMGYLKGYAGKYRPDDDITRGELASLLARILNLRAGGNINISFKDIKVDDWFAKDVVLATGTGYITGYEDNTFKPNNKVSINEIGEIIGRMLEDDFEGNFEEKDIEKIFPDGMFGSKENASRGEAASILLRYLKY